MFYLKPDRVPRDIQYSISSLRKQQLEKCNNIDLVKHKKKYFTLRVICDRCSEMRKRCRSHPRGLFFLALANIRNFHKCQIAFRKDNKRAVQRTVRGRGREGEGETWLCVIFSRFRGNYFCCRDLFAV